MTVIETSLASCAPPGHRWVPHFVATEIDTAPAADDLPGLDDVEQGCWQTFLDSSTRLLEALNHRLMTAHRLTMFDFLVLDLLARSRRGSARMGDLAQALVVGPSRVTQQVQRLEAEALVRRSRGANDGRVVIASITRNGLMRVKPAAHTYGREIRRHYLDQMSRNQMIAMGDSCRRISVPLAGAEDPERRF
jgi:DNA-binding MarR family transcriptional regulator